MGRDRRPYLPGAIIHLTARTVRGERWFTPELRSAAIHALSDVVPRSKVRLLAVAIMSNHLHLVVQQGEAPLSRLMQPLLLRITLKVHRHHGLEGPVFWRPYTSTVCLNPRHARNAIAYAHLNPVRAGICESPADYRWTSHSLYADADPIRWPLEIRPLTLVLDPSFALPLFAAPLRAASDPRADYRAFMSWRLRLDAQIEAESTPTGQALGSFPVAGSGDSDSADLVWGSSLSPLFHVSAGRSAAAAGNGIEPGAPDMGSIARRTLALESSPLAVGDLRGRGGGQEHARLRHQIIRKLHAAGYRNVQIAGFLGLSESAISYVLRRWGRR